MTYLKFQNCQGPAETQAEVQPACNNPSPKVNVPCHTALSFIPHLTSHCVRSER